MSTPKTRLMARNLRDQAKALKEGLTRAPALTLGTIKKLKDALESGEPDASMILWDLASDHPVVIESLAAMAVRQWMADPSQFQSSPEDDEEWEEDCYDDRSYCTPAVRLRVYRRRQDKKYLASLTPEQKQAEMKRRWEQTVCFTQGLIDWDVQ